MYLKSFRKFTICLMGMIILLGVFQFAVSGSAQAIDDGFEDNEAQSTAASIGEGWQYDLVQLNEDWYKLSFTDKIEISVAIVFDSGVDNLTLQLWSKNTTLLNMSQVGASIERVSFPCEGEMFESGVVYIRVNGSNMGLEYSLHLEIRTVGDNTGFDISDDYKEQGYEPHTTPIVIAYMALAATIALWVNFGFSVAQKSYYKGLGIFILTVALSESTYLLDLFYRDVMNTRFFNTSEVYGMESMLTSDYYIVIFTMLLVGLATLMYPMEKYLYSSRNQVFTLTISALVPVPLIIRYIETSHKKLNLDLADDGSFHYQMLSFAWLFVILIIAMAVLYLVKLYLDLGRKAPKGSELAKKSKKIINGLFLWLLAIFSTSMIMKEVSSVTSKYAPMGTPVVGTLDSFVQGSGLYLIFPILIPIMLMISLRYLVNGFTRDY